MGLFTLTTGIYSFCITLATSGINLAVVRRVSSVLPYDERITKLDKDRHNAVSKIMKNSLFYCLIFSVISTVFLFFCATPIGRYALGDSRTIPSLKIMALSLVPISISSAINGYFFAVRRVYKNVVSKFLEQGVKIGITTVLVVIFSPNELEYSCASLAIGLTISEIFSLVFNVIMYLVDRKMHRCGEKCNTEEYSNKNLGVFSIAFPVAISAYARSGLGTLEHLLIPWGLKKSGSSSVVALASYGILHGMVFPLLFFPSAVLGSFSSLLIPELSASFEKKDTKRISYITTMVMYLTLIFALGIAGVLICFSRKIGVLFYNSVEAGTFIGLLAPLVPIMYLDGVVDSMLKGLGEQLYSMRVNIVDSLISVFLIIFLLPNMGIKGYITVIFITELFNTSLSISKLLSITGVKPSFIKWLVKPLIAISVSTLVTKWIFDSGFYGSLFSRGFFVFELAFTIIMYILISLIIGAITNKELHLFKRLTKIN